MFIIYIIQSVSHPTKHYVGFTTNLHLRLIAHNARESSFSKKYAPWEVICTIDFKDERNARSFEKYLKHGSGHTFLKKHSV